MNKKFKALFKDTFIFALGSLGSRVILFFLVPLYTNYLSTEEYGIADLVFTTSQLLLPFVSVVIYEAVIRFGLMKSEKPEEVLKVGMTMVFIGSVFAAVITPLVGLYSSISEWKWYLCLFLILNFCANVEKSYLKVKNKNKSYALIGVLQTLFFALLNIVLLVVFHAGIKGYLIANIVAMAAAVIMSTSAGHVFADLKKAKLNTRLFREMVVYSAPLILNDISWWVIHSSDKFMVEAMVSAAALGIFTVATKIPSLINVLISIFGQAWNISSIKEMDSSNDTSFYEKVFAGYSFITFFACILIVAIVKPFMGLYVGKNFSEAWMYVPLLLVSAVFSSISSYFGQLYSALKKSVNNMLTTLLGAIVNIIVNYICIKTVGIMGAVIGTVVSYIVLSSARMIDVRRYVDIKIDLKRYLINCTVVITQAILVTMRWHISFTSIISVIVFAIINRSLLIETTQIIRKRFLK